MPRKENLLLVALVFLTLAIAITVLGGHLNGVM